VIGGFAAGLLHTRVQAQIGHQLLRRAEPLEVPDRGDQGQSNGRVDTGNRHQPPDLRALKRDPSQSSVDDPQLLVVEVELTQQRLHSEVLVGREVLVAEPATALDAEHVRERAALNQVAVKDRLHLILESRALPDQLRAPVHLPPERVRVLISDPHRRQIVRRQQLSQHSGIDLVSLDLRLRDHPGLHRVRHDHPRDMRLDRADDRMRVTSRLDRYLIVRAQAVGEHLHRLADDRDLAGIPDLPVLPDSNLRELPVHIQTDTSPAHCVTSINMRI
jgi:hypothetical protein